MTTKFILSKKCRWGVPGDIIEVSQQVANRLKQDGFGTRVSDEATIQKSGAINPDPIEKQAGPNTAKTTPPQPYPNMVNKVAKSVARG